MRLGTGTVLAGGLIAAALLPAGAGGVVGGHRAGVSDWGFTVAVRVHKRFICTGSVITPTKVLTAAHCAREKFHGRFRIVTGRAHLRHSHVGERIKVRTVRRYPSYRKNERHDLAVMTLERPTTAPPIQLATPAEDAAYTRKGMILRSAGYGDRAPLFSEPLRAGILAETSEVVRTKQRCVHAYHRDYIDRTMICTLGRRFGHKPIGATTCIGDSGGPLVADTASGPLLFGVTSYGAGVGDIQCGARAGPSVYARVSAGLRFIDAALALS